MTISRRLEFDGATPNNARLQQVIDELAADIAAISGGGGAGNPALPFNSVQFNDAGIFGGSLGLTFDKTAESLQIGGGGTANDLTIAGASTGNPVTLTAGGSDTNISIRPASKGIGFLQLGPDTYGADNLLCYTEARNDSIPSGHNGHYVESTLEDAASAFGYGFSVNVYTHGSGALHNPMSAIGGNFYVASFLPTGRTVGDVIGQESIANNFGAGTITRAYGTYGTTVMNGAGAITDAYAHRSLVASYAGTITNGYAHYASYELDTGTITNAFAYWSQALGGFATNAYSFWHDEQGVYRVRADNTFDSVYQAIPALYNPQFTKYTAGATNFERIFCPRWNGNVAEIGTEKGGTGTLRALRLIGTNVSTTGNLGVNVDAVDFLGIRVENTFTLTGSYGIQSKTDGQHLFGAIRGWADIFGTANEAHGVAGFVQVEPGGSVTEGAALFAEGNRNAGTFTNGYGLFVEDQINATNNWAIKTGLGKVLFGDTCDATGFKVAGVAGITTTVTTASLVGKTITFTNGIITGFA